jgi:hypothetical protein
MTFNDELDQVLEDALAEYREAEPLAGLEDRVLQRVKSQAERARRPWWQWNAIAAAAAVLAIAAWIGFGGRARHEAPAPVAQKQILPAGSYPRAKDTRIAKEPSTDKSVAAAKIVPSRIARASAPAQATAQSATVRDHFPSPAPLMPEERMLLALAQTHPEFLRELSRDDDEQEISIAPIQIKPLAQASDDNQGEN